MCTAEKCFCENKSGETGHNGIFCQQNGTFSRSGSCDTDEWCTGPSDGESAVYDKITLCKKGKNDRWYMKSIWW